MYIYKGVLIFRDVIDYYFEKPFIVILFVR